MLSTLASTNTTPAAALPFVTMPAQASAKAALHNRCTIVASTLCSLLILSYPSAALTQRMMQPGASQPEQTLDFGPTSYCKTSLSEPDSCGWWQEDYIALHANVVAGVGCFVFGACLSCLAECLHFRDNKMPFRTSGSPISGG